MKLNIIENPSGIRGENNKDSFSAVTSQFPVYSSAGGTIVYGQSMVSNDSYIITTKVKGTTDSYRVYLEIVDKNNLNTIRNYQISTNLPNSGVTCPMALKGDRLVVAMPVPYSNSVATLINEYSLSQLLSLQDVFITILPPVVKSARLESAVIGTLFNYNGYIQFGSDGSIYFCTSTYLAKIFLAETLASVTPTWAKANTGYNTSGISNTGLTPSGLLFDDSNKLYFCMNISNGMFLFNLNTSTGDIISQIFITTQPGYSYPANSSNVKLGILGQIDNDIILFDNCVVYRISKSTFNIVWRHLTYPKTSSGISAQVGLNLPYREMFLKIATGGASSGTIFGNHKDYTIDLDTGKLKKIYPTIVGNNTGYSYPEHYHFGEGDIVYGGENTLSLVMYKERRFG